MEILSRYEFCIIWFVPSTKCPWLILLVRRMLLSITCSKPSFLQSPFPLHLLGIFSSSCHLAIILSRTCSRPSKHSWSSQSLKKSFLYLCIFPQKLLLSQTKVAGETKESMHEFKSFTSPNLPKWNCCFQTSLYWRLLCLWLLGFKKGPWREWNTVQEWSFGVLDLDGHQIRN